MTVLCLKGWVRLTWTILVGAAFKWMSACSMRASIWSACRAENGGQSRVSAETWLANVVASTGSSNALGLFSSFFFISLWSVQPMLQATTWEQAMPTHFKCHMPCCCCWSAVLQDYVSSQSDWPGFSLRLPARSCTHMFALDIKRSIHLRWQMCSLLPCHSFVMPYGFVLILIFFFFLIQVPTSPFLLHIPSSCLARMSFTHILLVFAQCWFMHIVKCTDRMCSV